MVSAAWRVLESNCDIAAGQVFDVICFVGGA